MTANNEWDEVAKSQNQCSHKDTKSWQRKQDENETIIKKPIEGNERGLSQYVKISDSKAKFKKF